MMGNGPLDPGNNANEFDSLPEEDKACLLLWIAFAVRPAKTIRTFTDSYVMKHDFEHEGGFYVTNGEFKGAMQSAGYEPAELGVNWTYRVKSANPIHWTRRYFGDDERRYFNLAHLTPEQQQRFREVRQATSHPISRFDSAYPWLAAKE